MSSEALAEQNLNEASGTISQDSRAPLLSSSHKVQNVSTMGDSGSDKEGKIRKRDFFRFGKKTDEDKKVKSKAHTIPVATAAHLGTTSGLRATSPLANTSSLRATGSPPRTHPYGLPASPGRQRLQSASPRAHSPSTSQIFERSVQEDVVQSQASPQIPSHIITENHIPPALDASSEAITDSKLDPDTVEIVTHANHQPAAATITGVNESSLSSSAYEDFLSHISKQDTDNVSNYGSLDVGDVRRLSFISFADVVHAEHEQEEQRRDSVPMQSLGGHPALVAPPSPSPMMSPVSSQAQGSTSPTSVSISHQGHEMSPGRGLRGAGSPLPGQISPLVASELNIETMRQALRKTESGDLSGFRSGPIGAVGTEN